MFMLAETPATGYVGSGGGAAVGNPNSQDGVPYVNWLNGMGVSVDLLRNVRYHNSGWNYLFVDGHVENLLPEETLAKNGDLSNPKGNYWSANPDD